MDIAKSDVVRSAAGRDKGKLFFVLETEGEFLLLADGRRRRVERPKRKKRRHVESVAAPTTPAAGKIRGGEQISNCELRRTLAYLRGIIGNPDQEG